MGEWQGSGIWRRWSLTTNHSMSSHGQPVLLDPDGNAYGPGDIGSPDVIGQTEFAEILGWDRRKLSTYYHRGVLPKPIAKLASGPIWTKAQAERFKKLGDNEKD